MIHAPTNPNSIYVSMAQTGCLKVEFDSTYPIHLNGIISQEEFRDSINKINHVVSSNKIRLIFAVIFGLTLVSGVICFTVGGIIAAKSDRNVFLTLIYVGIVLTSIGPMLFVFGCCILQFRRMGRMRQAIAEESMKYSSRSPTPCSWRLDASRNVGGGYGNQYNNQIFYYLVIDIGRSSVPVTSVYYSNQVTSDPTAFFGTQDNFAPPPYSAQTGGFCSQCSVPRQDLHAKFCSSCGHPFVKR